MCLCMVRLIFSLHREWPEIELVGRNSAAIEIAAAGAEIRPVFIGNKDHESGLTTSDRSLNTMNMIFGAQNQVEIS